jgi:hypothetical protein
MSSSANVTSDVTPRVNQKTETEQSQLAQQHSHDHDDTASIHTLHTITSHSTHTHQPPNNLTNNLTHFSTHASHSHDAPIHLAPTSSFIEIPDEVYDRLPHHRKVVIVTLLSFCSFLAPISSTTILAAVPEVAHEYGTTGTIVNLSNALYMLFMGLSPMFWGPLSQVYGRRIVSTVIFCDVWGS